MVRPTLTTFLGLTAIVTFGMQVGLPSVHAHMDDRRQQAVKDAALKAATIKVRALCGLLGAASLYQPPRHRGRMRVRTNVQYR
mmetsp:Transcript_47510/g.152218  ORF Transcript_47510/g.152218 Transcript_47510/m.152218 type:complete len:83 (+) Transcript_47510:98-346(+)